jgi:hypothetical protein
MCSVIEWRTTDDNSQAFEKRKRSKRLKDFGRVVGDVVAKVVGAIGPAIGPIFD